MIQVRLKGRKRSHLGHVDLKVSFLNYARTEFDEFFNGAMSIFPSLPQFSFSFTFQRFPWKSIFPKIKNYTNIWSTALYTARLFINELHCTCQFKWPSGKQSIVKALIVLLNEIVLHQSKTQACVQSTVMPWANSWGIWMPKILMNAMLDAYHWALHH